MNPTNPPVYPPRPTKVQPPPPPGAGGGAAPFPTFPAQPTNVLPAAPAGGDAPLPSVPTINRFQFIKAYANMVARTWTDDSFRQLLLSDPVTALTSVGIQTIPGAQVVVVENNITGVGKVEDAVQAWIQGNQTGQYCLWLPIKPGDVDLTAGGGDPSAEGGASCCCTPCCCCT